MQSRKSSHVDDREELHPPCDFKNLPVELFETDTKYYVLDSGRVMFVEVDATVFAVLKHLRDHELDRSKIFDCFLDHQTSEIDEALEEIVDLQQLGVLKRQPFARKPNHSISEIEKKLSNEMAGLTVFVTTRCNLACTYCIFGGDYGRYELNPEQVMSWETARNMIDFLVARSRDSESVRLDFFGGEPMLQFELINRCVDYLKNKTKDSSLEIILTIASNGTILNEKMIEFLVDHNVFFQLSIDGGPKTHDRHRRFRRSGRGSYEKILENLEAIAARDGGFFDRQVRVKSVITSDAVEIEDRAFTSHPLIRRLVRNKHLQILNQEPQYSIAEDGSFFDRMGRLADKLLEIEGVETVDQLLGSLNHKERALFHHTLGEFFEIQATHKVFFDGRPEIPYRKSCLPGYGEGAVMPDGDICICQKATSFVIGNVNLGRWYFEEINELNKGIHDSAWCSRCFAQRFCDLCYEKIEYSENGWIEMRPGFCRFYRKKYRTIINHMLRILENNPDLWQHIDRLVEAKLNNERSEGTV